MKSLSNANAFSIPTTPRGPSYVHLSSLPFLWIDLSLECSTEKLVNNNIWYLIYRSKMDVAATMMRQRLVKIANAVQARNDPLFTAVVLPFTNDCPFWVWFLEICCRFERMRCPWWFDDVVVILDAPIEIGSDLDCFHPSLIGHQQVRPTSSSLLSLTSSPFLSFFSFLSLGLILSLLFLSHPSCISLFLHQQSTSLAL